MWMLSDASTVQESKSQLARLMAMENLAVEHKAKLRTARFIPDKRILYLPIWKDITDNIYNLFVGHEISHALHTPRENFNYWCAQIEPKKPGAAHRFLNIVEDCRIEKLIKRLYPGLRKMFIYGYQDLVARNFFGTEGRSYNSYGFIDRINIHFKLGVLAGIIFNEEEQVFVDRIENLETWDEVMSITKELYQYCKDHRDESPETTPECYEPQELDEDDIEYDSPNESFPEDDDEKQLVKGKQKPKGDKSEFDDKKTGEDKEGSEGDKEDESKETENEGEGHTSNDSDESDGSVEKPDDKSEGEDKKPCEYPEKKEDKPREKNDEPLTCETQDTFDQMASTLADLESADINYVNIPKVILDRIIVPYQEVHENIRTFYNGLHAHNLSIDFLKEGERELAAFKTKNDKVVCLYHQEFERRKAADMTRKTKVSKTGVLNTNRLHASLYEDDIFLSRVTIQSGKNHGLIIFIDFSGSMVDNLRGTIEQLITLIFFCRKAQIPFEVYGFGNVNHDKSEVKCQYMNKDFFIAEDFKLRQYFHHKMSAREFNEACVNMMVLAANCQNSIGMPPNESLGGTPLNETLIVAFEIIKVFKQNTGTQIVHTVVLSDGDANGGLQTFNISDPKSPTVISWDTGIVIFRDPVTRKEYKMPMDGRVTPITEAILTMLKDRLNINAIGFYIMAFRGEAELNTLIEKYAGVNEPEALDEKRKELNKEGFIPTTFGGYTEYFLIPGGKDLKTSKVSMKELGRGAATHVITQHFIQMGKDMRKSRSLITRFVKLIVK